MIMIVFGVAVPLMVLFLIHAALLTASTVLHVLAAKCAATPLRRSYHVMAAVMGVVTCFLALAAIWWTFPTRYLIAVAVAVSTYAFVWAFPAIITLLERRDALTADEVVTVLRAVKSEADGQ